MAAGASGLSDSKSGMADSIGTRIAALYVHVSTDVGRKDKPSMKYFKSGFTLIELIIVVGIIGILAAIALPNYNDYILKGKLAEGMAILSDLQIRQEQYYQDNRAYADGMTPRALPTYFTTASCATGSGGQSYTCTATAPAPIGYTYTITDSGAKKTRKPDGNEEPCWVKTPNGAC